MKVKVGDTVLYGRGTEKWWCLVTEIHFDESFDARWLWLSNKDRTGQTNMGLEGLNMNNVQRHLTPKEEKEFLAKLMVKGMLE